MSHRKGQTALEYLLIVIVAIVVVVAVLMFSQGSNQQTQAGAVSSKNVLLCGAQTCKTNLECQTGEALEKCGSNAKCANGRCSASTGTPSTTPTCSDGPCCDSATSQYKTPGTICRAAVAGGCDIAETCSGSSSDCPADSYKPVNTVCRASAGACDVDEKCTGTSPNCPTDTKSTAVCRASAGACDLAESCDGASSTCPTDAYLSDGTTCDDSNPATTGDHCVAGVCSGTPVSGSCSDGTAYGVCSIVEENQGKYCDPGTHTLVPGCGTTHNCVCFTGMLCLANGVCCGNGQLESGEACDDWNNDAGDGCSPICTVELGWTCAGSPSACTKDCGNGVLQQGEQCDDWNSDAGDGCSATCTIESSCTCTGELGSTSYCRCPCSDGTLSDDCSTTNIPKFCQLNPRQLVDRCGTGEGRCGSCPPDQTCDTATGACSTLNCAAVGCGALDESGQVCPCQTGQVCVRIGVGIPNVCVPSTQGGYSCTDTDGGHNIYANGAVSWTGPGGASGSAADYCADFDTVAEAFCAMDPGMMTLVLDTDCPQDYACIGSACVPI